MALATTDAAARRLVQRDPRLLAPRMEGVVQDFQNRCAVAGHPIRIYETMRSHRLARMYFALGRSKAPDGWRTWHFYGLGVDVIHPTLEWAPWEGTGQASIDWRHAVVEHGKAAGLDWGGEWISFKDWPHFQFNTVKPSPSDEAVRLYKEEGIVDLWRVVGAL
jgi:peptidoglycan L-alanyl-D-glutamate endopeptidase CwlK